MKPRIITVATGLILFLLAIYPVFNLIYGTDGLPFSSPQMFFSLIGLVLIGSGVWSITRKTQ